jgi:AcrR family transcriptional regulator
MWMPLDMKEQLASTDIAMKTTRSYSMTARARSTEQTRQRILAATVALHLQRPAARIGLDDIAARAEVSVQTILRHFGSRERLVEAATAQAQQEVREERRTPVGDVATAVEVLKSHYEARGDSVLVLLAQEDTEAFAAGITAGGKALHRAWVAETFAPYLTADDDESLLDLLVVATDVYTWKLLRRDRSLSRAATTARITRLVSALLSEPGTE